MNGAGHIVNPKKKQKKQLAILPRLAVFSNWAEMASADCPNHVSLKWKLAEISEHFPGINESDPSYCAEAVCATPTLGSWRVSADECEESGRTPQVELG